jgi:hypothetical protein
MVMRVKAPSRAARPSRARKAIVVLLIAVLAIATGCGSAVKASPSASASAGGDPPATRASAACSAAVLDTLSSVLQRVYREGVSSERTASAEYLITHSRALSEAVESGDRLAARVAARALLATGHMTNLSVMRGSQRLVNVGGPALAPLHGTLTGAGGAPIASYRASVWADSGFLAEAGGISQGLVALRAGRSPTGGRSVGGSPALGSGALGRRGALTRAHVAYQYTSFPARAYPSGAVRVYLLMPAATIALLCGQTSQDTTVNTLRHVANLIYEGELGRSAQLQVRRVQRNHALLEAVAHRQPAATRLAIDALLNEHIVRLRVSAGGRLLSDVGGPYVLAPVHATLRLGDHTIGSFVLSIQDDEGYLRLAKRLAGLDVLMYMSPNAQLVKNSLGPLPGFVPASGPYSYHGHAFSVFTVNAEEFPSGPLAIRVLVPIPYS